MLFQWKPQWSPPRNGGNNYTGDTKTTCGQTPQWSPPSTGGNTMFTQGTGLNYLLPE